MEGQMTPTKKQIESVIADIERISNDLRNQEIKLADISRILMGLRIAKEYLERELEP
jgi:hypothetical protein